MVTNVSPLGLHQRLDADEALLRNVCNHYLFLKYCKLVGNVMILVMFIYRLHLRGISMQEL